MDNINNLIIKIKNKINIIFHDSLQVRFLIFQRRNMAIPLQFLPRPWLVLRIFFFFYRNSGILSNFWSKIEISFKEMVLVVRFVCPNGLGRFSKILNSLQNQEFGKIDFDRFRIFLWQFFDRFLNFL